MMIKICGNFFSLKTISNKKYLSEILLCTLQKNVSKCYVTHQLTTPPEYSIAPAKKSDYEKIMRLLYDHFFFDEPLIKSFELPKRSINALMEDAYNILKNNKTLVATTNKDEVIGASINRQLNEWDVDADLKLIASTNCRKLRNLLHFWYKLTVSADLFRKYNIKDLYEVSYLVTNAKYRRYGVGSKLLNESSQASKNEDYYLMRIDATNNTTAVMCSRLRMNMEHEVRYENFKNLNGKFNLLVPKPHTCARVYTEKNFKKPEKPNTKTLKDSISVQKL